MYQKNRKYPKDTYFLKIKQLAKKPTSGNWAQKTLNPMLKVD